MNIYNRQTNYHSYILLFYEVIVLKMNLKQQIIDSIRSGTAQDLDFMVDGYDYLTKNVGFMTELEQILKIIFEDRNNDGTFNLEDLKILKDELESGNILLTTKLVKSVLLALRKVKKFKGSDALKIGETFLRIVSYGLLKELLKRAKKTLNSQMVRNELATIVDLLHNKVEELQLIHEISQQIYLLLKETGLWCCGDDIATTLKLDKEFDTVQKELRETINEKRIRHGLTKQINRLTFELESKKKE